MPRAPSSPHENASARTRRTGHDPVLAGCASSRIWPFPAICGSAGYLLELRCVAYAHAAVGGPWREAPAGAPWPPWGAAANTHPSTLAPAAAHRGIRTWEQEESPLRGGGCRNAGVEQILDETVTAPGAVSCPWVPGWVALHLCPGPCAQPRCPGIRVRNEGQGL